MQLLNTLYVTTPDSYLHLDNDTLRVEVEHDTRLRVPLHHLGAIVCLGNIRLSTPLMHRAADEGIALVMLDSHGRFKARLEGPVSGNVLLRSAQFDRSRDPLFALDVARNMVAGKIRNSRQILLRGARESKDDTEAGQIARAAGDLAAALRALPTASDLDMLRGLEGEAARQYFAARIAPWQRGAWIETRYTFAHETSTHARDTGRHSCGGCGTGDRRGTARRGRRRPHARGRRGDERPWTCRVRVQPRPRPRSRRRVERSRGGGDAGQ